MNSSVMIGINLCVSSSLDAAGLTEYKSDLLFQSVLSSSDAYNSGLAC